MILVINIYQTCQQQQRMLHEFEPVKFSVPFGDKDKAKSLGARWDPCARFWFAPSPHAADEMDRLWLRADCCEISTPSVLVRAQWVDACWADGTKGFVCSVCGEAVGAQFNRCACDVFHFENRCQAATAFAPSSTALPILPAQVVGTLATEKAAKKRRVYRPRVLSKPVPKGQPAVYFRANVD